MRTKLLVLFFTAMFAKTLVAQEKMYIHKTNNITLGALLSETDSVYFSNDGNKLNFCVGETVTGIHASLIDSIYFGADSDTITVVYDGSSVSVVNPLAFEGVTVSVSGTEVTITSENEDKDINYRLSGTTSNGMFKIYSDKRFNLFLDDADITNSEGPAINIQSKKKATVYLESGTTNTLSDGTSYANPATDSDNEEEDQKGTFFSEGKLIFNGSGSLTINGNGTDKHALCSDDFIEIEEGTINITSAAKDGIHAKDGIEISDGTLNITSTGDAIDGDESYVLISGGSITTTNTAEYADGITCDSTLDISGGTINMELSGDGAKAIKSDQTITLSGGTINIAISGDVVLESSGSGYDPSYCTAIKCDDTISVAGADITISSTGKGNKGISSDTDIVISAGNITITETGNGSTYTNSEGSTDSYHSSCITANGNITFNGGITTLENSGSAGKGISCDGELSFNDTMSTPVVNITTTGSEITITSSSSGGSNGPGGHGGGTTNTKTSSDEAKAVTCDGAITVNNAEITISSADDGMKSASSITINSGTISITKSVEALESPSITVNDGTLSIVASDDGFNATTGSESESDDGSYLGLYGGNIYVSVSDGDGMDSNGSMEMSAGTVVVHGPESSVEVGLDVNGTIIVSGGLLAVSGIYSNMTEGPSSASEQYSLQVTSRSKLSANTIFHIEDESGNNILTFEPNRKYNSVIFSSPDLQSGSTYLIYTGGSSTGTNSNGLYTDGTYSGGTKKKSFTVSAKVTKVSM